MLKFEIENLDGLEESFKTLYTKQESGKYRLGVEGLDPADELKGALTKQREETKEAKARLAELERMRAEDEQKLLESQGKFKELSEAEKARRLETEQKLMELHKKVADRQSAIMVRDLASTLTSDDVELKIIQRFAADYIVVEGDEVKFSKSEDEIKKELSVYVRSKANDMDDKGNNKGGGQPVDTSKMSAVEMMKLGRNSTK